MKPSEIVKLLAHLVHRGLLDADQVLHALAAPDPVRQLIDSGVVSTEQWQSWVDTNAGTRPKLTRYELGDLCGEGGEARVFRAIDRRSDTAVALKVLRPELAADQAVVRRFIAESKLLIELENRHIVKGLRVAREGATIFSVLELLDGVSLQDRLAADGPLDEDTTLSIVGQVATGLAYLHAQGLVHRDIKPGNIMLVENGRAVMIDLGFALRENDAGDSEMTAGTVHYISPEQARGQSGLDVRADIYSLGATTYHLLTGSLPFSGESGEEVLAKQVREALSGEEIRAMGLSPQVHYLIEKMMAKEKEIRFQDPAALAAEVAGVLEQRRREAELNQPPAPRRSVERGRGDGRVRSRRRRR